MSEVDFSQPRSFEQALELVNSSPTLRKIKTHIDNTELSADMKAILYDIAGESLLAL